jgi:hypothetical protein
VKLNFLIVFQNFKDAHQCQFGKLASYKQMQASGSPEKNNQTNKIKA